MTEEPRKEEPMTEEPMTGEPTKEEPMTEEPRKEKPMTEEPMTGEPTKEEPMTEEPMTVKPMTEEPMTEETTKEETTLKLFLGHNVCNEVSWINGWENWEDANKVCGDCKVLVEWDRSYGSCTNFCKGVDNRKCVSAAIPNGELSCDDAT